MIILSDFKVIFLFWDVSFWPWGEEEWEIWISDLQFMICGSWQIVVPFGLIFMCLYIWLLSSAA